MTNNDVIRRLRYAFSLNDDKMMKLFALSGLNASREQISNWLKKDENPSFEKILDVELSAFLNGFIIYKRGKKDGEKPINEKKLNNNIILRKLKIALNLKDTDMLEIFDLADMRVSKSELSAFFRKPTQNQYKICKDQFLRNFIHGLQLKYRK
jgi:uncharacterized protein YehS (DUF1456 family)